MEIIYDETIGDLEIIRKKNMYPAAQKEVLLKNFNEVFKDDTEMLETFESTPDLMDFMPNTKLRFVMVTMSLMTMNIENVLRKENLKKYI